MLKIKSALKNLWISFHVGNVSCIEKRFLLYTEAPVMQVSMKELLLPRPVAGLQLAQRTQASDLEIAFSMYSHDIYRELKNSERSFDKHIYIYISIIKDLQLVKFWKC
jgi:hypothetical protein